MDKFKIENGNIENIQKVIENSGNASASISIYGNSGTGKTYLLRESLAKYFSKEIDVTIVYIDLADDFLSTTAFWDIFLFTVWNGNINDPVGMIKIDTKYSMMNYLKKSIRGKKIANAVLQSIASIVVTIPVYKAQIEASGMGITSYDLNAKIESDIEKSSLLIKYLKHIAKKQNVIIALDNYQHMPTSIRRFFESSLNQIKKNIVFINIQRTDQHYYNSPIVFNDRMLEIETKNLLSDELYEFIISKRFANSKILKEIVEDCYEKTEGNLKEIDIYLRANEKEIERGILKRTKTHNLKNSLGMLSQIQRELVLLAALFPSGIRLEYVTSLMKYFYTFDDEVFNEELTKIITLGYVMLNSKRKDLLKPAHDKICLSIETISSTEDFLEFYNNIKNALEELIKVKRDSADYIYLLHCFVGICDSKKLINCINYLEELICLEYKKCAYLYLVELIKEYLETDVNIIMHISDKHVLMILDACQKTCSFKIALSILEIVHKEADNKQLIIYRAKILTQCYDFENALTEINRLPKSNETLLYKLIILEHLGRNSEIIKLLKELMNGNIIYDKWYYVILRNTAHFFTYKQAYENLNRCWIYFNKCGTIFEQATILNNMSVIHIWNGLETYGEAEKCIKIAINMFQQIGSNEVFEAYYNYGTLYCMQGQYKKAIKYYNLALDNVPEVLAMDVSLLMLNKKICECILNYKKITDLEKFILQCLNQTEILQDPWVRFQLEYNLRNIQLYTQGFSDICMQQVFENPSTQNTTELTVYTTVTLNSKVITFCLSLSPNWRY